jgi:uncharacterized membrane protein
MATSRRQPKGAAAYGREALQEWGNAIRYGGRAIAARMREGSAADAALARLGVPGRFAAKASLGSRVVDRVGGGSANGASGSESEEDGAASSAEAPFPIQESIDVAVPLAGAFELCAQFLDFPDYLERVVEVVEDDESHFVFVAKSRGRLHEMEVEIVDERANERIEWECAGELEHAGVLTFHPLAPRLTRLELTIERRPEGLSERLARQIHLPSRAIQAELHRFKAHAELLDANFDDYVPEMALDEGPADEEPPDEEAQDEEPLEDEEPLGEEPAEEEPVEEDELEPA